jgi:hypothetical protein
MAVNRMADIFRCSVGYTRSVSEEDIQSLYKAYLGAFQTFRRMLNEADDKLREEILARPQGLVRYRPQAMLSAFNGKADNQPVVVEPRV